MSMTRALIFASILLVTLFGAFYFFGDHAGSERSSVLNPIAWQRMASPGALSQAHAFLEHNCAACHTTGKSAEASNCITCHANETSLLNRQPTAFHTNIGSCRECHIEHRGLDRRPSDMDHLALSRIGFSQLKTEQKSNDESSNDVSVLVRRELLDWIDNHQPASPSKEGHSSFTPQEGVLNCAACHSTKDVHIKLFGQDCAQCHTTEKWTIPEYRHPGPSSRQCAQCHQAPPSHYMMHFKMISAKLARQPSAEVSQCYECHQTTSWNDIKGVGWYKHH